MFQAVPPGLDERAFAKPAAAAPAQLVRSPSPASGSAASSHGSAGRAGCDGASSTGCSAAGVKACAVPQAGFAAAACNAQTALQWGRHLFGAGASQSATNRVRRSKLRSPSHKPSPCCPPPRCPPPRCPSRHRRRRLLRAKIDSWVERGRGSWLLRRMMEGARRGWHGSRRRSGQLRRRPALPHAVPRLLQRAPGDSLGARARLRAPLTPYRRHHPRRQLFVEHQLHPRCACRWRERQPQRRQPRVVRGR